MFFDSEDQKEGALWTQQAMGLIPAVGCLSAKSSDVKRTVGR